MLTGFRHQRPGSAVRRLLLAALLGLSGCSPTLTGANSLESAINSAAPGIDAVLPQLILDKYIAIHNLQWELQQVDQTQGPVVSAPTIGTVTTTPTTSPTTTPSSGTGGSTTVPTAPTPNG